MKPIPPNSPTGETQVAQAGPKTPRILLGALAILLILVAGELVYLFVLRGKLPTKPGGREVGQDRSIPIPTSPPAEKGFILGITYPFDKQHLDLVQEGPFDSPEIALFAKLPAGTAVLSGFDGSVSLGGGFPVKFDYNFVEIHGGDGFTLIYYFPGTISVEEGTSVAEGDKLGEVRGEQLSFLSDRQANFVLRLLSDGKRVSLKRIMLRD